MKVLMLGWEFPPHISGGLGTACQGLVSGLVQHGVEVTFVLPRAFGDEPAQGFRILGVDSPLRPYLTGTEYASLGVLADREHYARDLCGEVARYAAETSRAAADEEFDLVHAHDWMTFPAGILTARARARPLVVHVHSSEFDRAGEHGDPRIHRIEQEGLDAADRIVCVSHFTARVIGARYRVDAERIRVVHNAVTRTEQRRQWRQEKPFPEPVVLFLGRVTFQKGPDYFLEAAARVIAEESHVCFVLGGTGDMLPQMIEAAARKGLARHVFFTGFLSGEDVERMYALADVYVMPSVSEPFGIAPLEAMALDVPVIVSRQSGVAEVLEHALTFDYWDVEDLAAKILRVLREPELRRSLVEPGRAEVARMRWEERARRLCEIYAELVA